MHTRRQLEGESSLGPVVDADLGRVRIVGGHEASSNAAFVELKDHSHLVAALALDRTAVGDLRISVKPALDKKGLDAVVKQKEAANARKKKAPPEEPDAPAKRPRKAKPANARGQKPGKGKRAGGKAPAGGGAKRARKQQ